MTTKQGKINKLKKHILNTIEKSTCQIYNKHFNNPKFTEKLITEVSNKILTDLLSTTEQIFINEFSPKKHEKAIANGFLNGIQKKGQDIEAMVGPSNDTTIKGATMGGNLSSLLKKKSITKKSKYRKKNSKTIRRKL